MSYRSCVPLLLLALVGCASDPAPTAQLELTRRSIDQARTLGGSGAVMQRALDGMDQARHALAAGEYLEASRQAEQAELDARLAEVQALVARTRTEQAEQRQQIRQLRHELGAMP